jgi:hypothetical protein
MLFEAAPAVPDRLVKARAPGRDDPGTAVEPAVGAGAVEGKNLLVIVSNHITRPAEDFSDQAKAFVFCLDRRLGQLFGGNERGREAYLTHWAEWIMLCDRVARNLGS